MSDLYEQWSKTRSNRPKTARPNGTAPAKEDDLYEQWSKASRDAAAERASQMIERVSLDGFTADDASEGVKLSDKMRRFANRAIPPEFFSGVEDTLTTRIERMTTRAKLQNSSKLSGWIMDSPVNAALAQMELDNLSGMEAVVDSFSKGVTNLTKRAPAHVRSTVWNQATDHAEQLREDRDRSFGEIMADEAQTRQQDMAARIPFVNTVNDALGFVNALDRTLMSRLTGEEAAEQQVEGTREGLLEAELDEQKLRDLLAKRYGRTASRAASDAKVAAIDRDQPGWRQVTDLAMLFADDPVGMTAWAGYVLMESAPSMAAAMAAGAVTRNAAVVSTVLGATSYGASAPLKYEELLQESGFDLRDPKQLQEFVRSPEVRNALHDKAFKYAATVGIVDALSGGVAGKALSSSPAGDVVLQGLAQGLFGASGEALGQLMAGEQVDWVETAVEGLIEVAMAPAAVRGVGLRKFGDARRAEGERRFFRALAAGAEASEMRKKAPKKYRELVGKLTADGPVETVYVDAQKVDELFQSNPEGPTAEQFLSALPGVDVEAYRSARESGGLVEIPTSSYATDVAGTEYDVMLREHLKMDPERMSAAEAQEYVKQLDELRERAKETVERAESGQAALERDTEDLRTELISRLRAAGRTTELAEREALQMATVIRTLANRLDITVDEFLQEYPLPDIQSSLATDPDVRPVQITPDMIDRARAETVGEADVPATAIREAAAAENLDLETATPAEVERALDRTYGPGASDVLLNQHRPADPADLTGGMTSEFLRRKGWGVVTAARGTPADAELNAGLEQELRDRGIRFIRMEGTYKGESDGAAYMIFADEETVRALGAKYDQESVLTRDGLVYMDGSPTTPLDLDDIATGDAARGRDFYSTMANGTTWSAGFVRPADAVAGSLEGPFQSQEAFNAWFGDSVVVDENGRPLVVYHGTQANFGAFRPWAHFGTNRAAAQRLDAEERSFYPGSMILPVYLSIQNPLDVGVEGNRAAGVSWDTEADTFLQAAKAIQDAGGDADAAQKLIDLVYDDVVDPATGTAYSLYEATEMAHRDPDHSIAEAYVEVLNKAADAMEQAGYDGIKYENQIEDDGSTSYIALRPEQVKSVNNRGTFDPSDPRLLYQDNEQVRSEDLRGDGRGFTQFFGDVTSGTRQQPVRLDQYEPVIDLPDDVKAFAADRAKFSGNFEDHIQTSIPGYREMQDAVGFAIAQSMREGDAFLDIGGSEGAMAKTVVEKTEGTTAVVLDPNTKMQATFEGKPQVEGATFDLSAFGAAADEGKLAWTEDDGTDIPFFDPEGQRYDVVVESMVFQFISDARDAQVARTKELMTDDGVFLTFEKFGGDADVVAANEAKKDKFKALYYDEETLKAKAEEVLRNGGDEIVGMTSNQAPVGSYEQTLLNNFRYVYQIWDSGNFKGYLATDSYSAALRYLDDLPSLDSEFATTATPRRVWDAQRHVTIPVNDDGTVTLTHWSMEQRDTLKVDKAGTGPTRGDERLRSGPPKLYFGMAVGQEGGYVRDVAAEVRHEVDVPLTDLYDFSTDPEGFKQEIPSDLPGPQMMGWLEQRIKDAGFKGYFVRSGPQGMSAVMYEDVAVDPDRVVVDPLGQRLFQSGGAEPSFFSALTREVENAKQKQANAKDWMSIISKLPGVKKAEVEWSGVEEWLAAQEGQVPREVVAGFLRNNEIQIETLIRAGENNDLDANTDTGTPGYEVTVSPYGEAIEEDPEYLTERGMDMFGETLTEQYAREVADELVDDHQDAFDEAFPDSFADFEQLVRDAVGSLVDNVTPTGTTPEERFAATVAELPSDFQEVVETRARELAEDEYYENPDMRYGVDVEFPDGDTEMVSLTVHRDGDVSWDGNFYSSVDDARIDIIEHYEDRAREMADDITGTGTRWEEYTEPGGDNYQEVLITVPDLHKSGPNAGLDVYPFSEGQHFDEDNIVVHVRLNWREAADGGKVMFVEEIQSDLGSYWREKGGAPTRDALRNVAAERARLIERRGELESQREELMARHRGEAAEILRGLDTTPRGYDFFPGGATSALEQVLRYREEGYRESPIDRITGVRSPIPETVARLSDALPKPGQDGYERIAAWSRLYNDVGRIDDEMTSVRLNLIALPRVPDTPITPFEGEAYVALAVKKLLRMAAEQGADRMAWTPAFMQARRWSQAVQNVVQEITWGNDVEQATVGERWVALRGVNGVDEVIVDGEGVVTAKEGGGRIPEEQVVGKRLSEVIGKTMADRVMSETSGKIEGENIVVGGKGFENVYDRQTKKFVEKFAKKYGGKLTIDKTMPDFVKGGDDAAVYRTVREVGYGRVVSRLRSSGLRSRSFWDALDKDVEARWAKARERTEENRADLVERIKRYEDEVAHIENGGAPRMSMNLGLVQSGLTAMKTDRLELETKLRAFSDPEEYAKGMFNVLVRDHHITARQIADVLPEYEGATGEPVWSVTISDKMREAAQKAQPLFQKRKGPLGSILLPRAQGEAPVISLFESADPSTVLHESGHYYLHILQDLVTRGKAPEQMQEDWATLRQWWTDNAAEVAKDGGVTEADVLTYLSDGTTGDPEVDRRVNVGLQEQWAKGFEAYLMEGKAPSNALRAAFEAFAAWLIGVYSRVRELDVSINDDVRAVFDRLLATDEEIAAAAADIGADHLVAPTAEALGVSEDEYRELVRLSDEAKAEARQGLLRDIMAPLRAVARKDYREERERVRAEIAEAVHAKPANRVREWLGNERWVGAPEDDPNPRRLPLDLRMNTDSVREMHGDDVLEKLPRGARPLTTHETTLTSDDVAGWFGYKSGDEMTQDLVLTPHPEKEINARTKAEMRKRMEDPVRSGKVEDQAVRALHGDKRGMLLAAELKAIGKQARGSKPTTRSEAARIARSTIRTMPVRRAVRSGTYLAAERRAGEKAALALARGDVEEAFHAKREQLLNHQLYIESKKASDLLASVEKRVAKLGKKSVREKLAGEYHAAIDDILTSYDFRKSVTQKNERRRKGLLDYVQFMTDAGREGELAIPSYVLDEARRRPYRTIPVQELEGVLVSLKNIEHSARMKQKLRDAQSERELTAAVEDIVGEMDENLSDNPPNRVATEGEQRRRGVREFMNLILNTDTILRKIGGFDRGKAYDHIKEPVDDAANWAAVAREEAAVAIQNLYSAYSTKEQRRMAVRRHYGELGGAFTKWDLISAALNMGNETNMARLMDKDSGGGFSAAQVQFIKDQLDARDWQFVQGVWDYLDSYWPLIEKRERRMTGTAPKRVIPMEVETPYGTLRGGYYPIKYRSDVSAQVNAEEIADLQKQMLAGSFGKAQTRRGHLEERTAGSGGRVLQLGIEVFHQHVGQVIHDLAFSEVVANTHRILQDKRVRAAFERKGLLEDHRALDMWIKDVATGSIVAGGVAARAALRAKTGFTLSKLAFNLSTVLIQITGLAQTTAVIGPKYMLKGFERYTISRDRSIAEVKEISPFMRERETTFHRDINDALNEVRVGPATSRKLQFERFVGAYGLWLMQKMQFYAVDMPTWLGAYEQGLDKFGNDETKARKHADRMVARAQASGLFSDRSAFERGTWSENSRQGGFLKLFTTLGSYMFAKGNIAYEVVGRTGRDIDGLNVKSLIAALNGAASLVLLFTVEAVLYNYIKGDLPDGEDEDEDGWLKFLAKETGLSIMSTIPFVRDVGSSLSGFDSGAYGSIGSTIASPFIQAGQGELDIALVKSVLSGAGVAFGLPSGQLNRVVDAWYRAEEGEDVSPVEYIMGRKR